MKRLDYETLAMEEVAVDMEYGFLAASVVNEEKRSDVSITGHEMNEVDFSEEKHNDWNNSSWN